MYFAQYIYIYFHNFYIIQVTSIKDNDSLASRLAVEIHADLLILLSDVEGLYKIQPGLRGLQLIHTYRPHEDGMDVNYGEKSRIGADSMNSKVT